MQTAAKVEADHAMDKGLGTEEGVSEEDMDILRKEYDEILESMKENGTTYAGLKSSASVICGFAGWMALAVDKEVKCPAFAICISLSAALSLSMVIIFTLLDITTARLSGYVKADFINDTCYYRAGGWLMLIYSLPLFLISFVLKFSCELDPPYNLILSSIFGVVVLFVHLTIGRLLYLYRPRVLAFFITAPIVGLGFFAFPDVFEDFGKLTSPRDWISYDCERLGEKLKKKIEQRKQQGLFYEAMQLSDRFFSGSGRKYV